MTGAGNAGGADGVDAKKGDVRPDRRVLIAHPSPDLYGSDLQMVSVVDGLIQSGWTATIAIPTNGPLVRLLDERRPAVDIVLTPFLVLRRAAMRPAGLLKLLFGLPFAVIRLIRLIRSLRPDVVYVNTVTIPWWVLAARIARVPVVVHVREAEEDWPGVVRWLLSAPLLLADSVVANSYASRRVLLESVSSLARRSAVIYNGIVGPAEVSPQPTSDSGPARVALVARLSPRKGVDVALDALGLLRAEGRDVVMDIGGTAYAGYEWFERELRDRAARPDLAGAVEFLGYVNPTWSLLGSASVVLVPSRVEPFGNTAVEAQLAARPVIASQVQGLVEIVSDDRTGLLVPPGDAPALAAAIARLLDDPELSARLATQGKAEAEARFSVTRYREDVDRKLRDIAKQ